jgi:hypothetical protein
MFCATPRILIPDRLTDPVRLGSFKEVAISEFVLCLGKGQRQFGTSVRRYIQPNELPEISDGKQSACCGRMLERLSGDASRFHDRMQLKKSLFDARARKALKIAIANNISKETVLRFVWC